MIPLAIQLQDSALLSDIEKEDMPLVQTLRQLDAVEEDDNYISLKSNFRIGQLFELKEGGAYLVSQEITHTDLFIEPHNLNDARHGDIVVAKKLLAKRGRPSAKVMVVLKHNSLLSVAYKKEGKIVSIKTELPLDFSAHINEGEVIKIKADKQYELLGHIDDAKVDEKISLALYDKVEAFDEFATKQASSYGDSVDGSMYSDRVDLRELPFCTIDPVTAKDFDDAIYYDVHQNVLYVAIADVSHYVNYYDAIDQEAKKRGFTIYLPHKSIPMLPRILSENLCSLNPHEDRLAFVAKLTLDRDYNPMKEEFFEALIHSKRRFDYEQIDRMLEDKSFEKPLDFLPKLYKITQILRQRRLKKGFDFATEELELHLDSEQNLEKTTIESSTPSHSLIEECMLLANIASSKVNETSIYRVHDKPNLKKLEELLNELATVGIFVDEYEDSIDLITKIQAQAKDAGIAKQVDEMLIKSLKQASYSSENIGHFGLGFESYSHFTSPIRRYSDLILHRLIKAKLIDDTKELGYLTRNLKPLCARVSNLEREATKVQRDYEQRKFARWAKAHVGELFSASVHELDEEVATVSLDCNKVDVKVRNDEFSLLDRFDVKITDVNIATCTIMGEVVG
ncbi:MAG: RNB domain-containing ribonuclease [Campylobacterota bacterium]